MASDALEPRDLRLWRLAFFAVWILTFLLLAFAFVSGGTVVFSRWWLVSYVLTAFSPTIAFLLIVLPFTPRKRAALPKRSSIIVAALSSIALGLAGFPAISWMKAEQVQVARESLGTVGDLLLPSNLEIGTLHGPADELFVHCAYPNGERYASTVIPNLSEDWILSSMEGTPNMLSPIKGGTQVFVICGSKNVSVVRMKADLSRSVIDDWAHPDGSQLDPEDLAKYTSER